MTKQYLRTDNTTKRIESVKFVKADDDSPDLSYLGEFSDKPEEVHIDRKERGDMGRGEFRYFNAGCGDPEYIEQDYKRMQRYNAGDWGMLYVRAEAVVSINGVLQTVTSGGLGGVESDSGADYFASLRGEEFAELGRILADMGFKKQQITRAIARAIEDDE